MTLSERFHEIRTGFERPFWIANISELFERLSYYAAFASLARYLGFVRLTETIREATKSAINSGIRRGLLGHSGTEIWRED